MSLFPSVTPQLQVYDPIGTYGCAFDHRVMFDGACNVGTSNITINSATASFSTQDIGKRVTLTGAGASGAVYIGTITAIQSGTAITVTPTLSTTVSAVALQLHTDDLASWTSLINDLNNSTYPGGIILMRSAGTATGFTNRSGISSFLPAITKQVHILGIGGNHNTDTGDYTKAGGSCIAYVGTSAAPTDFGAVMTIAPTLGSTSQALKKVVLSDFWIDCRNGDQNAALKGLILNSCHGFQLVRFFVMDAAAIGIEFGVVAPGVATPAAGSLGEAKDCSRGHMVNCAIRCLDLPQAGAQTTAVTTTTAVTLSNGTPQTLSGIGANTLPASGYVWVMTTTGYPVLVKYTGGGGSASLTGCIISTLDAIDVPATISGANIVQACPANACAIMLGGDQGANTNLSQISSIAISHGTTWGPAAVELKNSDSLLFENLIINGGNNTNDGAINRIRKPGVRVNGSNSSASMAARNNVFTNISAGGNPAGTPPGANFGGLCNMGLTGAGARLLAMAGPTYANLYQLANNEPLPIAEGSSPLVWTPNGGFIPGGLTCNPLAQTALANALTQVGGTLIAVPPQGFQIGTTIRWTIMGVCTTTATVTTIAVRCGTNGTTADAAVATFAPTSVAATAAPFKLIVDFTVRTLGATATAYCLGTCLTVTAGSIFTAGSAVSIEATMATFNSTTAQQFLSVSCLTGASTSTITPHLVYTEIVKSGNP